jgi:hypothetical protein
VAQSPVRHTMARRNRKARGSSFICDAEGAVQVTSMLSLPHGGVPTTDPCPRLHIILLTLVNQRIAFHARSHAAAEEWT